MVLVCFCLHPFKKQQQRECVYFFRRLLSWTITGVLVQCRVAGWEVGGDGATRAGRCELFRVWTLISSSSSYLSGHKLKRFFTPPENMGRGCFREMGGRRKARWGGGKQFEDLIGLGGHRIRLDRLMEGKRKVWWGKRMSRWKAGRRWCCEVDTGWRFDEFEGKYKGNMTGWKHCEMGSKIKWLAGVMRWLVGKMGKLGSDMVEVC